MIPSNLFGPRSHLFREVEVRKRQCEGFGGPGRFRRRRRRRASRDRRGEGEGDGPGIVCAGAKKSGCPKFSRMNPYIADPYTIPPKTTT